jgi:hypothetical protein
MKHVNTFENFLGEAKVLKKNDTTYGWHMALIQSDIFGNIKLETKIVPTVKGNHEPIEGSVTAIVQMGLGNSPSDRIKEYTIDSADAKKLSKLYVEAYASMDKSGKYIGVEDPLKEKLDKELHAFELDLFEKGLSALEDTFMKKEYK